AALAASLGLPAQAAPSAVDESKRLKSKGASKDSAVSVRALGFRDQGIFSDLDRQVVVRSSALSTLARGADLDRDGIPDRLDLLIGAHKTALNGATYGAGYIRMKFPGGDVPRKVGVCTDVIVRAARNAGLDIQAELQRDIRRSPRSYPMVKRRNPHIDHRRVKTLLPYFKRHWQARSRALDDPRDPLQPGDIVFMDTFPSRTGPDHIGIISDQRGPSGRPLVINNWTFGYKTSAMDLLDSVPVTHRFRWKR
ncbi:MAG: DUF1287 domain-containing protein, partial [Deltaproteobacteria bacterium]|nr:DUF1287 domain-containing protein [Deltaproteobacteria bacterium]